jgi:hypothetical protein
MDAKQRIEHESTKPVADVTSAMPRTFEILYADEWIAADRSVWRSWTGRRRLWGVEYHGDVYDVRTTDDDAAWDGPRTCHCVTCQRNVRPACRPN